MGPQVERLPVASTSTRSRLLGPSLTPQRLRRLCLQRGQRRHALSRAVCSACSSPQCSACSDGS